MGPACRRGLTILHVVPLNEVAAQVRLAHLLDVAHAHVKQVVLAVAQSLPQALSLQQNVVGGQGWGQGVTAHQSTEFLQQTKEAISVLGL